MQYRRSLRLDGWDYSEPAVYFITVTTAARKPLFGAVLDDEVKLSRFGEIAREEWMNSPTLRKDLELDGFVIMPNHVHGLVVLRCTEPVPESAGRFRARPLGAL